MRAAWYLAALVLASCAAPVRQEAPPAPVELPLDAYREALGTAAVFEVEPERSRIDIVVRRGGPLQRMGHDHVITARAVRGYAMLAEPGKGDSRADLLIDLQPLAVDEADARAVYGLETEPSESDIAGTARNLQEKVLESARWPQARVAIVRLEQNANLARCEVTIQIRGKSHTLPVDVLLYSDDAGLRARGVFDLLQSDLGIKPFSLLGGALSVRDRLEISFRVEASRVRRIINAGRWERKPGPAGRRSPRPAG